ncbi:MAG TPA: toluene-4-monooxygenase system B family protein [Polyangia bacterium]|nr:toluene-4-monooxygenase system B family protein [Polyangia bacterium]
MIPLYGFLEGDTIGLLILAQPDDTIEMLAEKLQASASVRVAPRPRVSVLHGKRVLDPGGTVGRSGLTALDRFDVVVERT